MCLKQLITNTMKTFLTTLIIVISFHFPGSDLFARKPYLYVGGGYGLPMNPQSLANLGMLNYTVNQDYLEVEQINLSLGTGMNFEGAAGYMFNENIGAELAFSYLLSDKSVAHQVSWGTVTGQGYYVEYTRYNDVNLLSKMLRFSPSLVFSSGTGAIRPFAKLGLMVGVGQILIDEHLLIDARVMGSGQPVYSYKTPGVFKWKINGDTAVGINAGMGSVFRLNERLALVGEIKMVNMSYSPRNNILYEAVYDDEDILSSIPKYEKEIEFVNSYREQLDQEPNQTKPQQMLKQGIPFGSIGMNLAIRIDL
jgi:hypothetical protein